MQIESDTLEPPVNGVNLAPGLFHDQLSERPTLLVFLRFFGCIFCRETVSDLRKLSEGNADFPAVLFVSEAGATEGRAFVRRYWPQARVIADPEAMFAEQPAIALFVARQLAGRLARVNDYLADLKDEFGDSEGRLGLVPEIVSELLTWRRLTAEAAEGVVEGKTA